MGEMYCSRRLIRPLAPMAKMTKAEPAMPPDTTRIVYCMHSQAQKRLLRSHAACSGTAIVTIADPRRFSEAQRRVHTAEHVVACPA